MRLWDLFLEPVAGKTVDASGYLSLWRVAEFLSEEKSDRFNKNLGVDRDNLAENILEKVGLGIM